MVYSEYFLHLIGAGGIAWILGFFWYSPLMFGKAYARAIGSRIDKVHSIPAVFSQFVALLVFAYVADILLWMLGARDFDGAWLQANALLIAFTLMPISAQSLWRLDKAPAWSINAYFLILSSFIITSWLIYFQGV